MTTYFQYKLDAGHHPIIITKAQPYPLALFRRFMSVSEYRCQSLISINHLLRPILEHEHQATHAKARPYPGSATDEAAARSPRNKSYFRRISSAALAAIFSDHRLPVAHHTRGIMMTDHMPEDLSATGRDLRAYTDALRPLHGVVRNVHGEWVLLTHQLVVQAALNDEQFSSAVSRYLQIPNGLDADEHTAYREALDVFLTPEALAPFHEGFRRVAAELVASLPKGVAVDAVSQVGVRFAVRAQSTWLGWPVDLENRLVNWVAENHAATRSGDQSRMQKVAESFDSLIQSVLEPRRNAARESKAGDVTTQLMQTKVNGQPLTDAEIVSVLRNWTGGDLGSIAQCIGVLVHYLATHPAVQDQLRAGVPDDEFDAIIDEILRIDNPFLSNRRITTCPVTIGDVALPQGARVKLNWTSANRDEATFGDPDTFDPAHNADKNLVYGIGRHVCPGRLLATLEMRIALQELLAASSSITLDPQQPAERAGAPVGGWSKVAVVLA